MTSISGKPSMIQYFDEAVIVWGLPSGMLIQTRYSKVFLEGNRFPVVKMPENQAKCELEFDYLTACLRVEP